MTKLKERIHDALSPLLGLPLWGAGRALNMEIFDFGARHTHVDRRGREWEVGEYSLHVQSGWRILGPDGIVVGSHDRHYPADESIDRADFDDERDLALLEFRMNAWINRFKERPLRVEAVQCNEVGDIELALEQSYRLQTFSTSSLTGEYSEIWRIFQHDKDGSHFVVTGYGIEE